MTGHLPVLLHSYAADRSAELQAEAKQARCLGEVRRLRGTPSAMDSVRRFVGAAMVRAGERVEGRVPADAALQAAQ